MPERDRPTTARTAPENGHEPPQDEAFTAKLLDPIGTLKANDAIFGYLHDGQWKDTQQHGRIVYDYMMRDTTVSDPFHLILNVLKTIDFEYRPRGVSPTDKQKEMAEFLNTQLNRLGTSSDYQGGWSGFVNGFFGQGLQYGFSLAEISTKIANWNGRPYIQLNDIRPLPQASLDESTVFQDENVSATPQDLTHYNYDCFDFTDGNDTIQAYVQNRNSDREVRWEGRDKLRILHFAFNTGDGNPFGQSLLWNAYYPWADKYIIERIEQFKLENADSYMTMSYDSDTPMPEVHKELLKQIAQSGDAFPVLAAPRSEWDSVSAISEAYSEHVRARKQELREEIAMGLMTPMSAFTETESGDVDSRNLIKIFLKFSLPGIIREVTEVLTWQLGKRLIDANYSHVEPDDYPVCRGQVQLDNDLRVISNVLQQLVPYLDADRIGEWAEEMLPGMQREWFPEDHEDSVAVERPLDIHQPQDVSLPGSDTNEPPAKEPGETRERDDGQTENTNQTTDTVA